MNANAGGAAASGEVASVIYGPVPSWRLGRSLGIDLVSTEDKTCSFDCIYCQLGRTVHPLAERREFVPLARLAGELEALENLEADIVTFSGMAEPTLAANLGEAIEMVRAILGLPVAVLTNSSLMPRDDVRRDLARADVVVAKLDAPTDALFQSISRPCVELHLDEVVEAIRCFRAQYDGKLALQMMFMEANKNHAPEMAALARSLSPDEVQINTPLRPCDVEPLPPPEIAAIREAFTGLSVITVYEEEKPDVIPLDLGETLRRRPRL